MDKNLVNIDDLFRQRLSGGEEEEKAGAWSNMRDLLDKEMPSQPVGGIRWRRMFAYTAGLLLLASAALGGYEVITAHRSTTETAEVTSSTATNNKSKGTYTTSSTSDKNTSDQSGNPIAVASTKNNSTNAASRITTGEKNNNATSATSLNNKEEVVLGVAANGGATKGTKPVTGRSITTASSISATHHKTSSSSNIALNNTVASNQKPGNNISHALSAAISHGQKKIVSGATPNNVNNKTVGNQSQKGSNNQNNTLAASDKTSNKGKHNISKTNIIPASGTALTAANKVVDNNGTTMVDKQNVDKIDIVQHYVQKPGGRDGHYANDTIDRTQLSLEKARQTQGRSEPGVSGANTNGSTASAQTVPVNSTSNSQRAAMNTSSVANTNTTATMGAGTMAAKVTKANTGNATASKTNTGTASSGAATSNTAANNVLLAATTNKATASKTSDVLAANAGRKSSTTLSNFAEMVRDFKTNMGNAKFAPGITGGINSTFFAPNSVTGFQLGVTGNFTFNDRWSFMAELKYFSRFSSNATINDNFVSYTPSGSGYAKDSVQRYFKYNNLQSIELPLTLRYTAGKYTVYLGGNIAYDFSINNDYVENEYPITIETISGKNIKPQFSESAFASRFGVGYLVGVGYHITPLLQADVRMVQTVWDNSSANGGAQVLSNNLYKTPSIQFSIGYTIKKKENRMP